VLLERYVPGRDLAVSIIEVGNGRLALPIVEPVPVQEEFYDFEARYEFGRTKFSCPARLPEAVADEAIGIALSVFELLGLAGFARVDLMLEAADGQLFALEADVIPGLTDTSLLPQAADAAGIGFEELVQRILDAALARV
jgi:D-alanine-D-alanine ligase